MNKMFKSDLYVRETDKSCMDNVFKYYQSTVFIPEFMDRFNGEIIDCNACDENLYYDLPESIIEEYNFEDLDIVERKVVTCISNNIRDKEHNCVLPIVTVFNSKKLISGHYAIDINANKILCYKSINEEAYKKLNIGGNFKLSVSYFVDIYRSTFYMKEYGFVDNAMFIGALDSLLKKELEDIKVEKNNLRVPQQFYTHELGINLKQQLLILTEFFK